MINLNMYQINGMCIHNIVVHFIDITSVLFCRLINVVILWLFQWNYMCANCMQAGSTKDINMIVYSFALLRGRPFDSERGMALFGNKYSYLENDENK